MLKASLIGNLGNDPEMKYSASGSPFLRFNVASNFRVRTPEGEWQDRTEWVRVTVFGARSETLAKYLKKGSRVFVDGRLEARPWTTKDGELRAGLEVVAGDVEFMSARQNDEQENGQPTAWKPIQMRPDAAPSRVESAQGGFDDVDLEDLPF